MFENSPKRCKTTKTNQFSQFFQISIKAGRFGLVFFRGLCYYRSMIIGCIVAILVLIFDQVTKLLVYGTVAHSIIGNFLWFESTFNTGVAFSMFSNSTLFFTIFSGLASILLLYLLLSRKFLTAISQKISLALLLGGTFSNFLDRLFLGGVRDFISLRFLNFAIFNVADMAIVVGVILLCLSILISVFRPKKSEEGPLKPNAKNKNSEENKVDD